MSCKAAMASIALVLVACNSGGPGPGRFMIDHLTLQPQFIAALHVSRTVSVTGGITFSDGDIAALHLRSPLLRIDQPISNPTHATSGGAQASVPVGIPAGRGLYPFEVWVTDAQGHDSNKLHGDLTVDVDGSATQWTSYSLGADADLRAAVWTGARFVVVGKEVFTSEDSFHWTRRPSGTHPLLNGLGWSGTTAVAVGDEGAIFTSPDGITWTAEMSPEPHSTLNAVVWAGSRFVATGGAWQPDGMGGWLRGQHDGLVLTSPDGHTWTRQTIDLHNRQVMGLAWSGALLVAGTGSDLQPVDSLVITSNDAVAWRPAVVAPAATYTIFDVSWSGSQFVGVSVLGRIFTSPDGATWTPRSSDTALLRAITWTGSHFVAVGWNLARSADGITWTGTSAVHDLWGVTWSSMQCVVVGSGGVLLTSP